MTTPELLLHIPHSSTVIPDGVRDYQFVLSDAEVERELLLMTDDRYVDELFALPAAEAVTVGLPHSDRHIPYAA